MRLRALIQVMIAVLLVIASCRQGEPASAVTNNDEDAALNNDSALAISMSDVETVLPQAGDVDLIENNCAPCHSLRYIEMQPELSYKTWEKIVDKMITVYGAPIRDSVTREHIINYLYAIKGKEEAQKGGH